MWPKLKYAAAQFGGPVCDEVCRAVIVVHVHDSSQSYRLHYYEVTYRGNPYENRLDRVEKVMRDLNSLGMRVVRPGAERRGVLKYMCEQMRQFHKDNLLR